MEPKKKRRVGKTLKLYKNRDRTLELRTGRTPYKFQVVSSFSTIPGMPSQGSRYGYYTIEQAAARLAKELELWSRERYGGPFELVESN